MAKKTLLKKDTSADKQGFGLFPTLYKRTTSGKTQVWMIGVRDNGDDTATIRIEQGQQGGKMQSYEETIREGKNLGRKNATTSLEQARAEAQARWNRQKDRRHYGSSVSESAEKRDAAPMLAQTYEKHFKKVEWKGAMAQPKYDGNRCLATRSGSGTIELWTRKGVKIKTLPHIEEELQGVMCGLDVFDGEVYVHDLHVTSLRSLLTREQEDCKKVSFRVYDVVKPLPFHTRFSLLEDRFSDRKDDSHAVSLVPTIRVMSEKELMKFQADCLDEGFEGAMLRWGEVGYEAGARSQYLLKVKTFQDAEFKIVDVVASEKYFNLDTGSGVIKPVKIAVFVCVTDKGHRFNVTAPGTISQKRNTLKNADEYIGCWLTVKFQCYTVTENPVPFQPVAKEIREDYR